MENSEFRSLERGSRVRAEPEDKPTPVSNGNEVEPAPSAPAPTSAPAETQPEIQESQELQEGQGTAIVTGAISIILGLAYIAITVALDSRGELLPPPPAAFQ